jgi:hypothetical protein
MIETLVITQRPFYLGSESNLPPSCSPLFGKQEPEVVFLSRLSKTVENIGDDSSLAIPAPKMVTIICAKTL